MKILCAVSRQFSRRVWKALLRRIFGFKGDVVSGNWRKWHEELPHKLQSSADGIWMIRSQRA
jgi:hypothetical protein